MCRSMVLPVIRQRKAARQKRHRLLTVIRGSGLLSVAKLTEKGFHAETHWGPFSFAADAPMFSLQGDATQPAILVAHACRLHKAAGAD